MKTAEQMASILRNACDRHPQKQKGWASDHGFSTGFVCDVCKGRRDASDRIANALGYERKQVYLLRTMFTSQTTSKG
jgi:hypothetical protein